MRRSNAVRSAEDTFLLGLRSYEDQDYGEGALLFRIAADLGHAKAQGLLACCYFDGRGVSQDHAMAARTYHLAADQGLAGAQAVLGDCYNNGLGVS
mmetsp:Transcript_45667/g.106737  ORF Transcript_45667/g.106737 Transcript_45667/m.106737 type:complete len:96 (+) Transcript_45667:280-567(+)